MSISKRLFDIGFSVFGMLALLPLFLLIMLIIFIMDGAPIFFRQKRVGYCGGLFRIYKFRTMVRNADNLGRPLTVGRDTRITTVGLWLRRYKLDELPQLINVLRGEMSLVGPRPEVPDYVAHYSPEQKRVLNLMPGITDPASIAFRDEASILAASKDPERVYIERAIPEKIRLNLAYAAEAGVFSDIRVILGTLDILLRKSV